MPLQKAYGIERFNAAYQVISLGRVGRHAKLNLCAMSMIQLYGHFYVWLDLSAGFFLCQGRVSIKREKILGYIYF